jgi:death-on-curing protein
VNRPFQSAFGRAAYPTTVEKAAALFHSLVTNHPFENGNKRTAVIAADVFLAANWYFLYLGQDAIYRLATKTAQHNAMGISARQMFFEIRDKFRHNSLRIRDIRGNRETDQFRERLQTERRNLRRGILSAIAAETSS